MLQLVQCVVSHIFPCLDASDTAFSLFISELHCNKVYSVLC